MRPMRLEPAAPRSQVKHSTTEPLHSRCVVEIKVGVINNLDSRTRVKNRLDCFYDLSYPRRYSATPK